MFPDCDNCDFYGIGDTCEQCRKHRLRSHRDYDTENYNDGEYEHDYDSDDDEYNL